LHQTINRTWAAGFAAAGGVLLHPDGIVRSDRRPVANQSGRVPDPDIVGTGLLALATKTTTVREAAKASSLSRIMRGRQLNIKYNSM
jgi:hypothetical protein